MKSRFRSPRLKGVSCCTGLILASSIPHGVSASSVANGPIVFERTISDTDGEIYRIDRDGSVHRLTNNNAGDLDPEWSPDGNHIAFQCRGPVGDQGAQRHGDICLMSPRGRNRRSVSTARFGESHPSWSPNGQKLVFVRYVKAKDGSLSPEIFKVNLQSGEATRLTSGRPSDFWPSWSPDGKLIAYVSDAAGQQDVYLMKVDGSSKRNISASAEPEETPSWSPNGNRLVFSRYVDEQSWQLFTMRRDGSDVTRITTEGDYDVDPVWSPNGKWILFTRVDDLFKVHPDGSDLTRVTGTAQEVQTKDLNPSWAPDR